MYGKCKMEKKEDTERSMFYSKQQGHSFTCLGRILCQIIMLKVLETLILFKAIFLDECNNTIFK